MSKKLLNAEQVAKLTGLKPRTVQEYFSKGIIPGAFPLGSRKSWVISAEDLDAYLLAKREKAVMSRKAASN